MIERYHRNPDKIANEDVAELVFLVSEERMQLTYHTENDKISASTREFIKPSSTDEKGATLQWHPDNHTTFQVLISWTDNSVAVGQYMWQGNTCTDVYGWHKCPLLAAYKCLIYPPQFRHWCPVLRRLSVQNVLTAKRKPYGDVEFDKFKYCQFNTIRIWPVKHVQIS